MAYWPHLYLLIFIIALWLLEKRFPVFMEKLEENLLVIVISSIVAVVVMALRIMTTEINRNTIIKPDMTSDTGNQSMSSWPERARLFMRFA